MIVDAHTHLPSIGWAGRERYDRSPFASVAEAVTYLRNTGTTAALFTLWQGVFPESEADLDQANAAALQLAADTNGYAYPGVSIHPAFPDVSRRWLARFREIGCRWVGELVFSGPQTYRYRDPAFLALAEECATHGHILQLHVHEDILEVARRWPQLRVVCSHLDRDLLPRLAELPNIWLDLSGFYGGLVVGGIEAAHRVFGPERLLYGTDFTGYEPRCFQVRLAVAIPDPAVREQVLCRNVIRLLALAGSRPLTLPAA